MLGLVSLGDVKYFWFWQFVMFNNGLCIVGGGVCLGNIWKKIVVYVQQNVLIVFKDKIGFFVLFKKLGF